MSVQIQKMMIEEIVHSIDIPESAYERAEKRYKILGDWFSREEAKCFDFAPHIYSQGSFRLGTVVRPLDEKDEYDLDVGCRLQQNVSKSTYTQKRLKLLVGSDLEEYRKAYNIDNVLEEKHRCWRLQYADEMSFHMDVVPSIPEEAQRRQLLLETMVRAGSNNVLAQAVAGLAGAITDNRLPNYELISQDWRVSNSEGYAKWFESRMSLAKELLERRLFEAKLSKIDELPARKWKSPLQRCIQILKRHRDIMFQHDSDGKPISIIITTLAAQSYQGEADVEIALGNILSRMGSFVRREVPRVPNPVNPEEDFADKWPTEEGRRLQLERNFERWLDRAKADFNALGSSDKPEFLNEQAESKFGIKLNMGEVQRKIAATVNIITSGKGLAGQVPKNPVDIRGGGRFG